MNYSRQAAPSQNNNRATRPLNLPIAFGCSRKFQAAQAVPQAAAYPPTSAVAEALSLEKPSAQEKRITPTRESVIRAPTQKNRPAPFSPPITPNFGNPLIVGRGPNSNWKVSYFARAANRWKRLLAFLPACKLHDSWRTCDWEEVAFSAHRRLLPAHFYARNLISPSTTSFRSPLYSSSRFSRFFSSETDSDGGSTEVDNRIVESAGEESRLSKLASTVEDVDTEGTGIRTQLNRVFVFGFRGRDAWFAEVELAFL
ncbi:hypothetical protein ACLOJK_033082 [Asimina triloba]